MTGPLSSSDRVLARRVTGENILSYVGAGPIVARSGFRHQQPKGGNLLGSIGHDLVLTSP